MNYRVSILAILVGFSCFSVIAQEEKDKKKKSESGQEQLNQKRIGIARIQVFAAPGKGFQTKEVISNPPIFFGEKSDNIIYFKKKKGYPPTTGDTIRDFTADSLAFYFNQDLTTMSGYDDVGGNKARRRNYIHDLPTENPQKMAVDSVFDESIDIGCFWSFSKSEDKTSLIPSVQMKMEIYDRMGQAKFEKSVTLNPGDIQTAHFKEKYGVEYDFVNGIKISVVEDGGILGNVIADVYLQALNKLLNRKK